MNIQEKVAHKIFDFIADQGSASAQEVRDYLELDNDAYVRNTLKIMVRKGNLCYSDGMLTIGDSPPTIWRRIGMMGKTKEGGISNGRYLDRLPGGM